MQEINGPWSEAQRVWIDATGPSAPVITGGSETYATSRTISVQNAATDSASGISHYEYYCTSDSATPTATTEGTSLALGETSKTFNTNMAGNYVYFRAVDVVGNKGEWSEAQRLYIDINEPKVSAVNSSVTIKKGDNVAMSTYFTTDKNGNAAISSTTYKIGSTSYSNTSGLAVGNYTVTCTVTKANGKSKSATMTLKVESALPSTDTILYSSGIVSDQTIKKTVNVPDGVTRLRIDRRGTEEVELYGKGNYDGSMYIEIDTDGSFWISVTPGQTILIYSYVPDTDFQEISVYYSSVINQHAVTINWGEKADGGGDSG